MVDLDIYTSRILYRMKEKLLFSESREVLVIDEDEVVTVRLTAYYNNERHNSQFTLNECDSDKDVMGKVLTAIDDISQLMFPTSKE